MLNPPLVSTDRRDEALGNLGALISTAAESTWAWKNYNRRGNNSCLTHGITTDGNANLSRRAVESKPLTFQGDVWNANIDFDSSRQISVPVVLSNDDDPLVLEKKIMNGLFCFLIMLVSE